MGPKKRPNRPAGKVYKCHNETPFESVICIISEDVYHTNDFTRRKCGILLSDALANCKNHTIADITSTEHVLTSEFRVIAAQIRQQAELEITKRNQQINELKNELIKQQQLQEGQQKLLEEQQDLIIKLQQQLTIQSKKIPYAESMDMDLTMSHESDFETTDIISLKKENAWLKEMNYEFKDKNKEIQEKNEIVKIMLKDKENNMSKGLLQM